MNKREFVAGGMAALVAGPALARDAAAAPSGAGLQRLLARTQRLPDLAGRAGAEAFEAYVGERFDVAAGAGSGEALIVTAVERVGRCPATEQFNVSFTRVLASHAPAAATDGVRLLSHPTGQRLALHLEYGATGYTARFNLLA
jgi:hypothetical protein